MSVVLFRRHPRAPGPEMPSGELGLQEPPALPEKQSTGVSSLFMYLPMVVSSGAMVLIFSRAGRGDGTMLYLIGGMLVVATLASLVGQLMRVAADRKRRVSGSRRDYLRYLSQTRRRVRAMVTRQRQAQAWLHPDPASLWSVVPTSRLWERRTNHDDFGEVRIGRGPQRLAMRLKPLQTKPVEDLEPLAAHALRRFTRAYGTVADQPVAMYLRGYARVLLRGDADAARGLIRAMLCQLTAFHSPDDLRLVLCVSDDRRRDWEWVKWLPHAQHPTDVDGAGAVRLVTPAIADLVAMLEGELTERSRFDPGAAVEAGEPYTVVLVDGGAVSSGSRFAGPGFRNLTVVDLSDTLPWRDHPYTLRLQVNDADLEVVGVAADRSPTRSRLASPDAISVSGARRLARLLAPYRMSATRESADSMTADVELTSLLGIGNLHEHDPRAYWAQRPGSDELKVPIGITDGGAPVELDIRESAQGGMGPHGMLIGATGSGKSELLRTLVLSLALSHSSEHLNFVLVDFKGGATFTGLERLPHTSAVITNLADEDALVSRMQDALHGELIRRQELLRAAGGYVSRYEYEQARADGAALDPLPTLFVVVDEFSELLASHREFMDLFIMIGRLGRSLGVHLLLASQRLDEGRIHALETHLSYRIGLRTFSAIESRSVLGVPDAYHLPTAPGNGFLRSDVSTLTRFKAAYVSGSYRRPSQRGGGTVVAGQVVDYTTERVVAPVEEAPVAVPETESDTTTTKAPSLLAVALESLVDSGPAAHQVWLPPLTEPPTLDQLLPPLLPDATFGYTTVGWDGHGQLAVPVGLVDRPFEQVRELLVADLSGAGGHVAVAGGPQSGKSNLLRTLVAALALTHTPQQVQCYGIDFGGGTLAALTALPHVGGVTGRLDPDRVARTVTEVMTALSRRERLFADHGIDSMATYRRLRAAGDFTDERFGDVFLIVDNWATMRQEFTDQAQALTQLASRALNYGVHLVVAANRWTDITPALRDQIATRFELKLGDPVESLVNMRLAATVPRSPGRGLTEGRMHFLTALPQADGVADAGSITDGVADLADAITEAWSGPTAPPVRMLPATLPAAELPAAESDLRVALGVEERELAPLWHDFTESPHLLVIGDAEMGKTNVLRLVTRAVTQRFGPDEARIALIDFRRQLFSAVPDAHRLGYAVSTDVLREIVDGAVRVLRDRVPAADVSPERLRHPDWWAGPRMFLIIDDYDMLGINPMRNPLEPLLDLLPHGAEIGLHVVVARAANGAGRAMGDPLIRRLLELNTQSLLMSCPVSEGLLFGTVKPRQLQVGRALRIARRAAYQVQTALVDD